MKLYRPLNHLKNPTNHKI